MTLIGWTHALLSIGGKLLDTLSGLPKELFIESRDASGGRTTSSLMHDVASKHSTVVKEAVQVTASQGDVVWLTWRARDGIEV